MMDVLPPNLTALHTDTGFAFSLSDEAFSRWWAATVLPEDAAEFVHLHHGTLDEARYVCALDFLTNVMQESANPDTVVKAYFLAKNQPIDLKDSHARVNAHYLSTSDATDFLRDRVRVRARRVAEERIANRTTAKIEELFERTAALDGKERLETERAALETAIKFLGNQARERGQEAEKRTKRSIQAAMERTRNSEYDVKRVPSLAEARLHLAMLVDAHGPDAVAGLVAEVAKSDPEEPK